MQLRKRKKIVPSKKLANGNKVKVEDIDKVKLKLHDNRVKIFEEVRYVLKFKRYLISLDKLVSFSYRFSIQDTFMRISLGVLIIIKAVKLRERISIYWKEAF